MDNEPKWKVNKRKSSETYQKENYKKVLLRFQNSYYDSVLCPAADKLNEPVATFIKKAIAQRIEHESLYPEGYNDIPEKLQSVIDETYTYIKTTISGFAESGRSDRVQEWENKLNSKIRYYVRATYELTRHEQDQVIEEVTKRYQEEK